VTPNLAVIGVAAGLSVIIPVVCVIVMQIARFCRRRHLRGDRSRSQHLITGNTEQSVQTEGAVADLPPSYSTIFGTLNSPRILGADVNGNVATSGTGNPEHPAPCALISVSVTNINESDDVLTPSTSRGSVGNISVNSGITMTGVTETPEPESGTECDPTQDSITRSSSWRRRFPGMHISIMDLFRRGSTDDSVIEEGTQTPPPTYKDAVTILSVSPISMAPTLDTVKEKEEP